jgi:hypothetical protein
MHMRLVFNDYWGVSVAVTSPPDGISKNQSQPVGTKTNHMLAVYAPLVQIRTLQMYGSLAKRNEYVQVQKSEVDGICSVAA